MRTTQPITPHVFCFDFDHSITVNHINNLCTDYLVNFLKIYGDDAYQKLIEDPQVLTDHLWEWLKHYKLLEPTSMKNAEMEKGDEWRTVFRHLIKEKKFGFPIEIAVLSFNQFPQLIKKYFLEVIKLTESELNEIHFVIWLPVAGSSANKNQHILGHAGDPQHLQANNANEYLYVVPEDGVLVKIQKKSHIKTFTIQDVILFDDSKFNIDSLPAGFGLPLTPGSSENPIKVANFLEINLLPESMPIYGKTPVNSESLYEKTSSSLSSSHTFFTPQRVENDRAWEWLRQQMRILSGIYSKLVTGKNNHNEIFLELLITMQDIGKEFVRSGSKVVSEKSIEVLEKLFYEHRKKKTLEAFVKIINKDPKHYHVERLIGLLLNECYIRFPHLSTQLKAELMPMVAQIAHQEKYVGLEEWKTFEGRRTLSI